MNVRLDRRLADLNIDEANSVNPVTGRQIVETTGGGGGATDVAIHDAATPAQHLGVDADGDLTANQGKPTASLDKTKSWPIKDQYSSDDAIDDFVGNNAAQAKVFAGGPVDMIVILSRGAVARAGKSFAPTATKGEYCDDGVPTYIIVSGSDTINVFAPPTATISIWGYRY